MEQRQPPTEEAIKAFIRTEVARQLEVCPCDRRWLERLERLYGRLRRQPLRTREERH